MRHRLIRNDADPKFLADKAGLLISRFKCRLSDRAKAPRSWWYPKIAILNGDEPTLKRQHDECSKIIQRVWLVIAGFSFFCLITLSAQDASLLGGGAEIKLALLGVTVSYNLFLLLGPIVLLGLAAYLHIFVGQLRKLEKYPLDHQFPYLFNLSGRMPRLMTSFVFYWLVPIVLFFFAWKATPNDGRYQTTTLFALLGTVWLTWLQIRRSAEGQQRLRKTLPFWLIITLCSLNILAIPTVGHRIFTRHLDLYKAQLAGKNLREVRLEGANLEQSDLSQANLEEAMLRGVNLKKANLEGANLKGADLSMSVLFEANLQEANLSLANLHGANLTKTNVEGANLERTIFQNTILDALTGLKSEQIARACLYYQEDLPHELGEVKRDEFNCPRTWD
jgi:hypothetical protein